MKLYYTETELLNLTPAELLELTTFGGDTLLYYEDLVAMYKTADGYEFIMKNHVGEESIATTQSEEIYNSIKLGKSRYMLLSKTLQSQNELQEAQETYFKGFNKTLEKMSSNTEKALSKIKEENARTIKVLEDEAKRVQSDIFASSKVLETNTEKALEAITKKTDTLSKKWTKQISELSSIDTKGYDARMKKVDKLLEVLDQLLAE